MESVYVILLGLGCGFALWHELRERRRNKDKARREAISRTVVEEEELLAAQDTEKRLRHAVVDLLAAHVVEHESTLRSKRRQSIFLDAYGVEDRSRWDRELRYFIDRVCDQTILRYFREDQMMEELAYDWIIIEIDNLLDENKYPAKSVTYTSEMSGLEFERLVAERLVNAGADVRFTPATGDQGADLIVEHNGETIVIQCKRSASTVGNKAVQEAYAGRTFYDAEQAWVVSDAPFSRAARQLAGSLCVRLVDFDHVETAL